MKRENRKIRVNPLLAQLRWFIRLRWIAGLAVIFGALADLQWLHLYPVDGRFAMLGAGILIYNVLLYVLTRRPPARLAGLPALPSTARLITISWMQILLDLACLTLLTLWSGGIHSPLLGFYVFHMVFASLLLPRRMAYGGASAAMLMIGGGLGLTNQWPEQLHAWLILAGWAMTLLLTVYLANQLTQSLRRQRRRLARQNRRISIMSRRLRNQQQAMIQHEKMVALGQMAAGIAHEIANPLASMDSMLEVMQRHPERDRPEKIGLLQQQAMRIKQIIQQMTAFAHPSQVRGQWVGVNAVVEAAMGMVGFDPRIREVKIERHLAPQAAEVQVDSYGLEQVIVNLVLNALDAMEGVPGPHLAIRTDCDGQWCSIAVSDNGHGIAPEHVDHLFEPFFTTKPVGKGTGLGLAISYSLVRRLGGRIDVETAVGKGSTFAVRWPMVAGASGLREAGPS
ncbi:MAG: ATP-binding protein [Planctomycetota bacterium]|nr:ATP-binding protein [Planctomycetota bacterium]